MTRPVKYLTAIEAADVLRVGPWTVIKLCRDGKIPATKPVKSWLIAETDLDAYLADASNRTSEDVA